MSSMLRRFPIPYRGSWISGVRGDARSRAGNPAAATSAKNPIVNDPEAAALGAPVSAPERATEFPRYSRSDQEREAAEALATILRSDDSVKRDKEALPFVQQFMSDHGYGFSERGFLERIWRDARGLAKLPLLGKPGAKKNSTHSIRRTAGNSTHQR
jgi:hypothetical protein